MTATLDAVHLPDFGTVLARFNRRQVHEVGEEVLSDGQVHELAELLGRHAGDIAVHTSGSDDAARKRDELATLVEQLRVDLGDKRAELGIQQETTEALRGDVKLLQEQLASITAERDEAIQGAATMADELAAARQHRHAWPLAGPDQIPEPCSCGLEFPQQPHEPHPSTPAPAEPDKWSTLFDQIRQEWGKR